jgi:hypothetical protein
MKKKPMGFFFHDGLQRQRFVRQTEYVGYSLVYHFPLYDIQTLGQ